jgi:hypothetical protein
LKRRLGNDELKVIESWHQFEEPESYGYRDCLSVFAETDPFKSPVVNADGLEGYPKAAEPMDRTCAFQSHSYSTAVDVWKQIIRVHEWERFGYAKKDILRTTWVEIEKRGEAGRWLKNVGTNGIEEWKNLMYNVVQYGEMLEKEETTKKAKL